MPDLPPPEQLHHRHRAAGHPVEHEDLVDDMPARLSRNPDPMTLRRCTVAHPFGTIKTWMGATHFPTRRLKNVRTEMALNIPACNIKRMVNLIGIRRLMTAIPG